MAATKPEDEIEVSTVRSTKKGWKKVKPLMGTVPRRWVRTLFTSNDLLAFWVRTGTQHAVVPVDEQGMLEKDPGQTNLLWTECERLYEEHRSQGGNNPKTLRARIDYGSSLSRQLPEARDKKRLTVLYPKSSDIMRAARVARQDEILNDTLYYWKAGNEDEAAYLVALLNAPALGYAFLDARQSGRHFQTHFWNKVPIPLFDKKNKNHLALVKLTIKAEQIIEPWMADPTNTQRLQQVGLSKRIRRLLEEEGILDQIDKLTGQILPNHAST